MSETAVETKRRSPWKKWLIILGLLLLPVLIATQMVLYFHVAGSDELQAAFAEADRLDPGWRWEEIEAKRAVIPDKQNSALVVLRIGDEQATPKLLPRDWASDMNNAEATRVSGQVIGHPDGVKPPIQFTSAQFQLLQNTLAKVPLALAEARKLTDMPKGRFPLTWRAGTGAVTLDPHDFSTLARHGSAVRTATMLLCWDAKRLAHEEKTDEAIQSCRAALNATRSFGDEPLFISMLSRIACRSMAVQAIERVLAQGQGSEKTLAELQHALEEEAGLPLFLMTMRGERALTDKYMQAIQSREVTLSHAANDFREKPVFTGYLELDKWLAIYLSGSMKRNRAEALRFLNRVVEIAKLPVQEQQAELDRLAVSVHDLPFLARQFAWVDSRISDACNRDLALMQSVIVAIAAERFRLASDRWPERLEQLTPKYLAAVPLDPFAKSPLRLRRTPEGVTIYSVGPNAKDDDGTLWQHKAYAVEAVNETDIGFELWEVSKRRQK